MRVHEGNQTQYVSNEVEREDVELLWKCRSREDDWSLAVGQLLQLVLMMKRIVELESLDLWPVSWP